MRLDQLSGTNDRCQGGGHTGFLVGRVICRIRAGRREGGMRGRTARDGARDSTWRVDHWLFDTVVEDSARRHEQR
jgi:hypothetical protein